MTSLRPPFPAWVDSSLRSDWASCATKWKYRALDKIEPTGSNIHLVAGGSFARGLEVARRRIFDDGYPLAEAITDGKLAAWIEWGNQIEPKFQFESEMAPKKALDRVMEAIEYYFEVAFPPHSDPVAPMRDAQGKSCVEFGFALPVPGTRHPITGEPIIFTGRFDMLGLYNDTIFCVDEKTTSQLGQTWVDSWDMRAQFSGYCWAAREYGYPVAGAIVRGISFLTSTKTNPSGFGNAQAITFREDWRIEQWLVQLRRNIDGMILAWESGFYDMDLGEACTSYGGCPFKKLCLVQDPERWISDYERSSWNPLAPRRHMELPRLSLAA